MMSRFCATISGEQPMRFAISSAMRQFGRFLRYSFGTSEDSASAVAMRCASSKFPLLENTSSARSWTVTTSIALAAIGFSFEQKAARAGMGTHEGLQHRGHQI